MHEYIYKRQNFPLLKVVKNQLFQGFCVDPLVLLKVHPSIKPVRQLDVAYHRLKVAVPPRFAYSYKHLCFVTHVFLPFYECGAPGDALI